MPTTPYVTTLPASAALSEILAVLERDGAVILERFLSSEKVDTIVGELGPFIDQTAAVGEDFSGHLTTRTGGLVALSAGVRDVLLDPTIYGAARDFLAPYTDKIQLNGTQVIRLLPGQGAQTLHRDRFVWGKHVPRDIEPQLNTIFALTEFTAENGATLVVPGSHRWDWERKAEDRETTQAVMPRGSVLIYTGTVVHGGGENRSSSDRIAMALTYCNAWLRQEENQYMCYPPEIAASFEPELRALIGYTMGNYSLGYYAPPEFTPGLPGTLPPELVFERGPLHAGKSHRVAAEGKTF